MKGVINENKDIIFLKEEFKTFVAKKEVKEPLQKVKTAETPKETLILEEVEL